MCRTQYVLALLTLYVGLALSFSWDFVVGRGKRLEFYNGETLTYSVSKSYYINWIFYDPLHDRVLFAYKTSITDPAFSFDIANGKTQSLIKKKADNYLRRASYDPATELLFGIINKIIYSFSLKTESNNADNRNIVINLQEDDAWPRDVAVDSCGGYIYWTTSSESNIIERVRFNGSGREVIIENSNMTRRGLIIDPQTQKMYWIEYVQNNDEFSIESADLNGRNRRRLYRESTADSEYSEPETLTISKDFIYWGGRHQTYLWQLPKNPTHDTDGKPKQIAMDNTTYLWGFHGIATNYKIDEQTQGVQNCNALKRLLPNYSDNAVCGSLNVSTDESLLCVHGTKVSGETRCECTQGYSGERCDVSVCYNYCFQGECSASAEGQPKCRCNADYSGERCEVNACHDYCLNNGVCSLNDKSEPVCQCTGQYVGKRCDIHEYLVKYVQTISMLKDILQTDVPPVTLGKEVKSTCASTII